MSDSKTSRDLGRVSAQYGHHVSLALLFPCISSFCSGLCCPKLCFCFFKSKRLLVLIKFQTSSTESNTIFSQGNSHNKWEPHSILFPFSSSDYSCKIYLFGSLSGPLGWVSPHLISFLEFVIATCGRINQRNSHRDTLHTLTYGTF